MLWPWGSNDLLLLMASSLWCSKIVCRCTPPFVSTVLGNVVIVKSLYCIKNDKVQVLGVRKVWALSMIRNCFFTSLMDIC